MSTKDDLKDFEQGRIRFLQQERLKIQKKTFTKWVNSFLDKVGPSMHVDNLFTDLADGKKLLKLLEIISGEKLGRPNNGKMRVHFIENVNKSLAFLHTKVRLESIGAEDIVDGNERLTLGLIWTIILRFQIQEIEIDVDEENESSEKKNAKDALLLWCQRKTNGYPYVNINDFSGSWRDGMGFNALIHSHRPDLFDFSILNPRDSQRNLEYAFDVAQRELGIAKLLDAEDLDTHKPDEKSIITYVASYYHTFARMKTEMKGGKRIAKVVGQMMEADNLIDRYEMMTTSLLEWIRRKVLELDNHIFPNSLEGIQLKMAEFKKYITAEKPPKYQEMNDIEATYFNINLKLSSLQRPPYQPQEGLQPHSVEKAWNILEKSEYKREIALKDELLRQEQLETLAQKFDKKGSLREGYVKEMILVLKDPRYGSNLNQVEATVKKHEAISADILARQERFHDLIAMADELDKQNYHDAVRIKTRQKSILLSWEELLSLLEKHRLSLGHAFNLVMLLREVEIVSLSVQELENNFKSEDVGRHLMAVEDLLQKHNILESEIVSLGEAIKKINKMSLIHLKTNQSGTIAEKEEALLQAKVEELNSGYDRLKKISKHRRALLEDARIAFQFFQDHEEEEAWVLEKKSICQSGITATSLQALLRNQQKHRALQDEMKARWPKAKRLCDLGHELISANHTEQKDIQIRINSLENGWKQLRELAEKRKVALEDASEACQFFADVNEAESWLKEKLPLARSQDCGSDETSAQALLSRHKDLIGQINAYQGEIKALSGQADRLVKMNLDRQIFTDQDMKLAPAVEEDEVLETVQYVDEEYFVEEPIERTEFKTVTEDRLAPQVKSLYAFKGEGIECLKGEIMLLLDKTNNDWWLIRRKNLQEGYVPANYVREIEPDVIKVQVRKPVLVTEIKRVKKIRKVPKPVPVKKTKLEKLPVRKSLSMGEDTEGVEERKNNVVQLYKDLSDLSEKRKKLLEDSIRLFAFNSHCDDFSTWAREKEKQLQETTAEDGVEVAKRKFEAIVTDMSANRSRIEKIGFLAEELLKHGTSQAKTVKLKQKEVERLWDHLYKVRQAKEKSLQGASSVELFYRNCDEAKFWMAEKLESLGRDEFEGDLKTVQALQRRHEQLERELLPVEDKVRKVKNLAQSVKSDYPTEAKSVAAREQEVTAMWEEVKEKSLDKRTRIETAVGAQIFLRESSNLLAWADQTLESLFTHPNVKDVATAEESLKEHEELFVDIKAHQDEFKELIDLGQSLNRSTKAGKEVVESRLKELQATQAKINSEWKRKNNLLKQILDLQNFNKEADQIDAATSSHEALLEFSDLGNSLDEVEALIKRHDDFESILTAQDEKIKAFSEKATKLIKADHFESNYVKSRRDEVINRRQKVKDEAASRRKKLEASQMYQEFATSADDLRRWIDEKKKNTEDESYRDLSNLERKLQKHEAFERELRANEGRLKTLNKAGQNLISKENYRAADISTTLENLKNAWENVVAASEEKGKKLRQAAAQQAYNRDLDIARARIAEIEESLITEELPKDVRSSKDLLKRHQQLENDLRQWDDKSSDIIALGDELAVEGHFDAVNIQKEGQSIKQRICNLQDPITSRRLILEESKKFHQFRFTVEAEMQWIQEHMTAVQSEVIGHDLYQAQMLDKKHKKTESEILGHQAVIDNTLESGKKLVEEGNPEKEQIEKMCKDLEFAWKELKEASAKRRRDLDLSLRVQQFFSGASDIESWLTERQELLSSKDYGKDAESAIKFLTKHKAIELELDAYSGLINELCSQGQKMIEQNHPESKAIEQRKEHLQQTMKNVQKLATMRRQRLVESMNRHDYLREVDSLKAWIVEQMVTATSEDFGQDYEHLLLLRSKFDEFKLKIESGTERFKQCDELANKLIAGENPHSDEVEQNQQIVSQMWDRLLESVDIREQRLHAAGEIHRFNRDVADALARIQEKSTAVSDDLGRDLNSALTLWRKHENFVNDLVALEAQLQVLIDDAARLQSTYPGQNADHIKEQQIVVVKQWETLQAAVGERQAALQASIELQKFLSQVRDINSWSRQLCNQMSTIEKVSDTVAAQALAAEHQVLFDEIKAREESYLSCKALGEAMVKENHYASEKISEKVVELLEERERLHLSWKKKKVYLDQQLDLQFFLKDAKMIEVVAARQEAAFSSGEMGTTEEEVSNALKKHEALEKLVITQEEKLSVFLEQGEKLVSQNHYESVLVKKHMKEATQRRVKVKELCAQKRRKLQDALLYAQFVQHVTEANSWIDERQIKIDAELAKGGVTNLDEKAKKLQWYQTFHAELAGHQKTVDAIREKGDRLVTGGHTSSRTIATQQESLMSKWHKLLSSSASFGRGLDEAKDILEFNSSVESMEGWIRDKELMVQAGDVGQDYEHCLSLKRKLDDQEIEVVSARMKDINDRADKLVQQGRSDTKVVQQKRAQLNDRWQKLRKDIEEYRMDLEGALEIHGFNRDIADTEDRLIEKTVSLSKAEKPRTLEQVEKAQRKQENFEMELQAIDNKLKDHEVDTERLIQKFPDMSEQINEKLGDVREKWKNLLSLRASRKDALIDAFKRLKFFADAQDLEAWIRDMMKKMEEQALPDNLSEAESALQLHRERKAEIDGRQMIFTSLRDYGENLQKADESSSSDDTDEES
ncbi:hypothetical protein QYM36_012149, partial [Artemia franciscana]